MKLFAPLAPILVFCAFAESAVADEAGFGIVGAIAGEPVPAGIDSYRAPLAGGMSRERYRLAAEYDRAPDSVWYGFVEGGLERERVADGQVRSVLSSGPGYRFYDNDQVKLSLQGGLSYSNVDVQDAQDNRYAGLNWGFNWEQTFFDQHLNFFHRHFGNQGFDSGDTLTINAETGVRVPLLPGFSAIARYELEWERSPHDEARNADHAYILGVGYDW